MMGFRWRTERCIPVRCSFCRKLIAGRFSDGLVPSPRELTTVGAVPMKDVGWFCSRRCVSEYESCFRVILEPEPWGAVARRIG
jgi:hypothetical protein